MSAKKKSKPPEVFTTAELRRLLMSNDPVHRLEGIGYTIYGREWKTPMAVTLGVARQTVFNWIGRTSATPRNLDEMLLSVTERAADAHSAQRMAENLELAVAALKNRVKERR
jgi:hypothetical protein